MTNLMKLMIGLLSSTPG